MVIDREPGFATVLFSPPFNFVATITEVRTCNGLDAASDIWRERSFDLFKWNSETPGGTDNNFDVIQPGANGFLEDRQTREPIELTPDAWRERRQHTVEVQEYGDHATRACKPFCVKAPQR